MKDIAYSSYNGIVIHKVGRLDFRFFLPSVNISKPHYSDVLKYECQVDFHNFADMFSIKLVSFPTKMDERKDVLLIFSPL